jgi:hypothetical protein
MERRHGRREETAALLVGWVRSCFRGGCHSGRAASAVARTCLPHAASGDVGHDTSLDARPLVDRIVVFLWSTSRQRQPWAEVPVHSGHGARERAIEHSITTERHGSGLRSAFGQCDCRITSLAPIKVWALNSAIVRHYHQATDLRRQRHQGIFRGPSRFAQERVCVGGQGALEPALWLRSRRVNVQRWHRRSGQPCGRKGGAATHFGFAEGL